MFSISLCLFNLLFMTARVVLDVAHLTSDIQKHCRPAKSTEVLLWIHQFEIKSHGLYLRQQKPHSNNKQTDKALHICPNVTWYCVNTHTHSQIRPVNMTSKTVIPYQWHTGSFQRVLEKGVVSLFHSFFFFLIETYKNTNYYALLN